MTDDAAGTSNRSSIDLSLELERQLDSESLPGTPAFHTHPKDLDNRTSLDPHVLAHIVTQLRDSVTYITRERDDLVHQLAESHSREAEFKDSLALLTERCASLETGLEAARKKSQDDDEAISMLRSKVEESRRGLMRLQSERNAETKRMTLDLGHPRTPSFGSGPRSSSHRSSFTPLTGSGHPGPPTSFRPQSATVSESDPGFAEFVASLPGSPGGALAFNETADSSSSLVNRRRSMFGAVNRSSAGHFEGRVSPSMAEIETVKRELTAAKTELEETRHELTEANEAREASESCVKALRDFISQLGAGDTSSQGENVRLPPLPTDSRVKDMEPEPKPQKASGWGGLKLWRVDTGTATSASQASPGGRPSMDSHRSTNDRDSASPSTAVPLRNKFGAFFTRGSSLGSITIPPHSHQEDEPMLNGSDVSSLTEDMSEPISPAVDKVQPVFVQEAVERVEEGHDTQAQNGHSQGNGDTLKVVPR
ncbi:hypothetical protein JB92DRAFT_2710294 [Gautieria morchelliformis]|nr:hypothetical protein JB92DRAFT_2710294 [Gautieria morchelliformis]